MEVKGLKDRRLLDHFSMLIKPTIWYGSCSIIPCMRASTQSEDKGIAPWFYDPKLFHEKRWDMAASKRYCRTMAQSHYENFPVFLSLFTRRQQDGLAAIYAFARTADDFVDEPEFEGMRDTLIESWENQLLQCGSGKATHPILIALGSALRDFNLSLKPFLDLLDAFKQDCRVQRYETYGDLLNYCARSANPVGRLVLGVLGIDNPELTRFSDSICTALQLTNFWQDLSIDIPRNRLYLPLEDLERFSIPLTPLRNGRAPAGFDRLMGYEIRRTRKLFQDGKPLLTRTGYKGGLYFTCVWLGGTTVLNMVKDARETIVHRRPSLSSYSLARAYLKRGARQLPMGVQ
jgi:squalene synthase HpnC